MHNKIRDIHISDKTRHICDMLCGLFCFLTIIFDLIGLAIVSAILVVVFAALSLTD